ncbi:MAG: UDP-N-acetylmuramoyl-L-alanine--D-glutamate ligase, partial [Deltaproteobacteria bacterium]|nr:UDP-N-acetylmuramoyl-L-alanine--D-glutamate ligase [Deltaproteobacteria bacterium]
MIRKPQHRKVDLGLSGRRVLVVGLGASGAAAAKFLRHQGAVVTVADQSASPSHADQVALLADMGVETRLGDQRPELFQETDLIVISPGVPTSIGPLAAARRRHIPIIGELELAARFVKAPIIAVTGTNGKTTTTSLIAHLLSYTGLTVQTGGNIGTPLIECVASKTAADVLVVEVSSFQLETIETFRPRIAVLLNITPDHLDRYDGFEAYAQTKGRIFSNQQPSDTAIINGADPVARNMSRHIAPNRWLFNGEGSVGALQN